MRDQVPGRSWSLFEQLACGSMGYCCPYAFFRCHKSTGLIATRLGLAVRTIRVWKAKFKNKEIVCEQHTRCMLADIRSIGK